MLALIYLLIDLGRKVIYYIFVAYNFDAYDFLLKEVSKSGIKNMIE